MTQVPNKSQKAKEMCENIKHICKTFGSRYSGSEGERAVAEAYAQKASECADSVAVEDFDVYPKAYLGWIALSVTCAILSYVAYFLSPMIAILLLIVGAIPLIFQYALRKRMMDPLFKKATSLNVTALKRCSGEPKRRIYLVANVDACKENSIKHRLGGVVLIMVYMLDSIGVLYYFAISIARWALVGGIGASLASDAMLYVGIAGAIFLLPLFLSYFTVSPKVVVDGANSNLSGCEVAISALEALKDVKFENTEVGVILTGSEAVGQRGSKNWCDIHAGDVDKDNTLFLNIHALRELSGLRTYGGKDGKVVNLVVDSAKDCGLKCAVGKTNLVKTDNIEFCSRGLNSAELVAIDKKLPEYYHTRYDSYDNLGEECLGDCYELVINIILKYAGEDVALGDMQEYKRADDEEGVSCDEQNN